MLYIIVDHVDQIGTKEEEIEKIKRHEYSNASF